MKVRVRVGDIRSLVTEGAVDAASATEQGLALCISAVNYVLYDPDVLEKIVNEAGPDAALDRASEFLYGFLEVGSRRSAYGAAEVKLAAARRGFGPLLYDVAMARENGLVADRESVSRDAGRVWMRYIVDRPDVKHKLIDDKDRPKTPPKIDDDSVWDGGEENPLNYAYFIDHEPNTRRMQLRHQATIRELGTKNFRTSDLIAAATLYFRERYVGAGN